MKKLFSFRLSEELMEDVKESASAEGISVTKFVEIALEKQIRQQGNDRTTQDFLPKQPVEPMNQPRSGEISLLRELLEILIDREAIRGISQKPPQESQDLKELKEQVTNLESMMRSVFKENLKDANPLPDYSKCNT